jgi:hypothetical protein
MTANTIAATLSASHQTMPQVMAPLSAASRRMQGPPPANPCGKPVLTRRGSLTSAADSAKAASAARTQAPDAARRSRRGRVDVLPGGHGVKPLDGCLRQDRADWRRIRHLAKPQPVTAA